MLLNRLTVRNFRNYELAEACFDKRINLFLGQNAQGKTNLLEAIYLLAIGRSFRTTNERELARHGTEAFKIEGDFTGANQVGILVEYAYGAGGKTIRQNGVQLRRAQELFGQIKVVLFTPDDLQLLKGGPENRRSYLDLYVAQVDPRYRFAIQNFQRLLAQRNEILRRLRDGLAGREELSVWNQGYIERAVEVVLLRLQAMKCLSPLIARYHQRISGGSEEIELDYALGGRTRADADTDLHGYFQRELAAREREEIARGLTVVGPHRDDIAIGFASGHALRSFGSQGQQRTAALAMKLAAVDFLSIKSGEEPIVLLDDVMSEFDDLRQHALLRFLLETKQTMITATSQAEFKDAACRFRVFHIDRGRLLERAS